MKKSRSCLILCLVSIIVLSFPIAGVFATKPVYVCGTGASPTFTIIPVKLSGPNTFLEVTGVGSYTGDFVGTTLGIHRWHVNKDGQTNMHAEVVFTGTVLGESGSITMLCTGIAGKKITWRIVSGTGDLTNLRGGGILLPGIIEGYVHFDP